MHFCYGAVEIQIRRGQNRSTLRIHDEKPPVAASRGETEKPKLVLSLATEHGEIADILIGMPVVLRFRLIGGWDGVFDAAAIGCEGVNASAIVLLERFVVHEGRCFESFARLASLRRNRGEPTGIRLAHLFVERSAAGIVR